MGSGQADLLRVGERRHMCNKRINKSRAVTACGSVAVGLLLSLLLGSCTVGPDYIRPSAEVPAAYKETKDWKKAEPGDELRKGPWWEVLGDPQLNSFEEKVNVSNQNVAFAEAQFRQARALVQEARAGFFPNVTAGVSATRSRSSSSVGSSLSSGTVNNFMLPLDVSWEPDLWGRIRRTVEASEASAQASAADLGAVSLSMQAELAQDYFQLRTLDAQSQLLEETVAAYRKSFELTKNRYASGIVSRSDVLLAETQLKTTQAQAIDIGVQRAQLEHAIAVLLGRPASTFSIAATPLEMKAPPPIPAGLPSELLERRADIAAAERLVAAANAQIGVAEAAYYPTITLSGAVGLESSQLPKLLNWPSRFWSIGASVLETVFDGGQRKAASEAARAAYDATVATYRQTVIGAFQEVEDNLSSLRILEEEAQVQVEAVTAARQSLAITTNQYKAGTASYLDVIVTQAIALNNERVAIGIFGSRITAAVLLIKALGGGWDVCSLPAAVDCASNGKLGWLSQ
ncbi:MAG TPA: efflux transporter outer membrane subunit [Bacteroidota bacterium]|nr:efflux transporter outer membrane subunit [Bacteroidota bacterium]